MMTKSMMVAPRVGSRIVGMPALHVCKMASSTLRSLATLPNQVATLTINLPGIDGGRRIAASVVNLTSHEFDMRGADTGSISAKMIPFKPMRTVRRSEFMRTDVDIRLAEVKLPVSVRLAGSDPDPAWSKVGTQFRNRTVLVNLIPETGFAGLTSVHKAKIIPRMGVQNPHNARLCRSATNIPKATGSSSRTGSN